MRAAVEPLVSPYGDGVAVVYTPVDAPDGGFAINGDERMRSASMIKTLIMATLLQREADGSISLGDSYTIRESDIVGGNTDVCAVRKLKEEKHPIEYLQPAATAAILDAYGTEKAKHRRNRMLLILMYDTGARVQELSDLNVSSLHLNVQHAYVTLIGKGKKSRNVPILEKTVQHMLVFLRDFHPKGDEAPLFYSILGGRKQRLSTDSISMILKTAADIARNYCAEVPARVHCHLMRKTKAMDLYRSGVPLPFIMQLLGHESMSTTSGFYAFATLEMMADAMNKATDNVVNDEKLWKSESIRKALYSLD